MSPRSIALALALALAAAAVRAAGVVESVPLIPAPLSPTPVVAQLRADLATLGAPASPALPPSAIALSPAAWTNLQSVLRAAPPTAAAPTAPAPAKTDAVKRLSVAQGILGRYDPSEFDELPADRKDAAMAELWDGWRRRGLVEDRAAPSRPSDPVDALVLEGIDDRALTSANKSTFLGVGVLGYPLDDALWLQRTRISDALDDNALRYPEGQRWRTEDGTPEFLGKSARAQPLVDAWGAATDYGRQIVRQVQRGSRELPESAAASPAAAAAFARLVAELVHAKDREAVEYLTGRDPTFSAFLLDARKPGYYLYNGERSVVARIMATNAARELGVRRLDHAGGNVVPSTYFYRPARVAERLREAAREGEPGDEDVRRRLAAYAERLAPLVSPAPAPTARTAPYRFVAPEFLPGSALDSPANRYDRRRDGGFGRVELPLPLGALRARQSAGDRYGQFSAERWSALGLVLESCPELAAAQDELVLRFVAEPSQSRSRLIAPQADGKGVAVQLAVLDDVARLEESDPEALKRELRFLAAAFSAALKERRP